MTKLKSKKITKSTVAVIIMAIAMVAMLAFGGTYAYFTAKATDVTGTITTGVIKLTSSGSGTITISKSNILPKETLLTTEEASAITYSAEGATRAQIVFFTYSATASAGTFTLNVTAPTLSGKVAVTAQGAPENTYAYLLAAGSSFSMAGLQVAVESTANYVQGGTQPAEMGATITLTIQARSVQAVGSDGTEISSLTAENANTMYALAIAANAWNS